MHISDSSKVMKEIYKNVNKTETIVVERAEQPEVLLRPEVCSLKNAIDVHIDGKLFCLAHTGRAKHKDAFQICDNLNATLPLPKSFKESYHLIESFKRLRIDKKMEDFSTKIILDVRRLPNKGKVDLFLAITF